MRRSQSEEQNIKEGISGGFAGIKAAAAAGEAYSEAKTTLTNDFKADALLFVVLIVYYFYAWGRLGQKFALAVLISLLTGFVFWLIKLAVHNPDSGIKAKEIQKLSGEKKPQISLKINTPSSAEIEGLKCSLNKPLTGQQQTKMPFCRQLFLFFPLFYPLGLNLSLIPFLLIVVYLLAISSFGGYEKHFFNPTALLIVFMLAGYSYTASLSPSKPIASPQKAYKTYTSGVPGAIEPWRLASKLNTKDVIKASFTACLPGFAATACPGALLILAIFISVAFKRRPLWVACSCLSLCAFTAISQYFKLVSFSCLHILFLGMFPAMLLISASDYYSISGKANEQAVSGIIFGFFTLLFTAKTANPLAAAYAVLSAQILSPLISDIIFKEAKEP